MGDLFAALFVVLLLLLLVKFFLAWLQEGN